jgi:hypothetical protein
MEQQIEEKIGRRADEISLAGGTDLTVAVCAWTADTMVVVLEWFDGDEPQREIIGGIPLVDPPENALREIRLGSFVAVGVHSLSAAFKAIQQARTCNQPIWHGTVDGQLVTVRRQLPLDSESQDSV